MGEDQGQSSAHLDLNSLSLHRSPDPRTETAFQPKQPQQGLHWTRQTGASFTPPRAGKHGPVPKDTPSKGHTTNPRFLTQTPTSKGGDAFWALPTYLTSAPTGNDLQWRAGCRRAMTPPSPPVGRGTQPQRCLHRPASR